MFLGKKAEIIGIFGKQGYGKTHHAREYIKNFNRVIVLDRMGDYPELKVINDIRELYRYCEKHQVYAVRVTDVTDDLIDDVCWMSMQLGDLTIVFEEAGIWFGNRRKFSEEQNDLLFRGRHSQVNRIFVIQRANNLPIDIRSQISKFIIFNQTAKNDIKALEAEIGEDLSFLRDFGQGDHAIYENGELTIVKSNI